MAEPAKNTEQAAPTGEAKPSNKERLMGVAKRAAMGIVDGFAEKIIPQGAAEIAQAIFSDSNAYVPYGSAQSPPKEPEHGVHGPHAKEAKQEQAKGKEIEM